MIDSGIITDSFGNNYGILFNIGSVEDVELCFHFQTTPVRTVL
jgi:hypothetical protein